MFLSIGCKKKTNFFVSELVGPQTIALVKTSSEGFHVNILVGCHATFDLEVYPTSYAP